MELQDTASLAIPDLDTTCSRTANELKELEELYDLSYPGNAFDPRMVLSETYFGVHDQGRLVSAGGIHVISHLFKVAAVGNITTHPDFRNQGFGRQVTSRICRELVKVVDFIGLNVKADNLAAIRLYKSLGFEISSKYGEFSFKK